MMDSTNMNNQKRPAVVTTGAKDAVDLFVNLLRTQQTSTSDDDMFKCLCIMVKIETAFFRASINDFFSHWETMTIEPLGQMAIRFRERWR